MVAALLEQIGVTPSNALKDAEAALAAERETLETHRETLRKLEVDLERAREQHRELRGATLEKAALAILGGARLEDAARIEKEVGRLSRECETYQKVIEMQQERVALKFDKYAVQVRISRQAEREKLISAFKKTIEATLAAQRKLKEFNSSLGDGVSEIGWPFKSARLTDEVEYQLESWLKDHDADKFLFKD